MDATSITITIGISEVVGIVVGIAVPMIGGFFTLWKASADAHKNIIDRLGRIETDMSVAKNDLDWLKHHARAGQPPTE